MCNALLLHTMTPQSQIPAAGQAASTLPLTAVLLRDISRSEKEETERRSCQVGRRYTQSTSRKCVLGMKIAEEPCGQSPGPAARDKRTFETKVPCSLSYGCVLEHVLH